MHVETITPELQSLAREARTHFMLSQREDGSEYWGWSYRDKPVWLQDLVREAHGEMLPDDYRYAFVVASLDAIADADADEDVTDVSYAAAESSIYTSELTTWLSSNLGRVAYCDEAIEDGITDPSLGLVGVLSAGQTKEREEVFWSVVRSLAERVEA